VIPPVVAEAMVFYPSLTEGTVSLDGVPTEFRGDVTAAIAILKKLGATKIYLFGSIVSPHRTEGIGDIDIAVDGLPRHSFFRAYGLLMMQLHHKFDLVDLGGQGPFVRNLVESGNLQQVA
jgi:predicted nucleotidyltransferase